jgi:hypothetical protein
MSRNRRKKRTASKGQTTPVPAVSMAASWHDPVDRLLSSLSSRQLQILTFVVGCAAVISRRPDAILNPQFWAEDGREWYRDAYAGGLHSLLHPSFGYLQSLPHFVALTVQPFPLLWAPAVFNTVAIAIQVLPAMMLVSRRFMCLNLPARASLALFYLAVPNSWDVHANLTNAQWHLALLALAVTLAEPSPTLAWRIFDLIVLVFASLTGPFCLALAPIAFAVWWWRRDRRRLVVAATLAAGAVIQTAAIFSDLGSRSHMALGASPALLIKILSRQVFLGAIEGGKHPVAQFTDQSLLLSSAIVVTGVAVLMWAFCVGPLELRCFLVFGFTIFAAGLASPLTSPGPSQWEVLFHADGARYWLFPMLVFMAVLVRLLSAHARPLRWAAAVTLLACFPGIVRDWRMPAYEDLNFSAHARAFSQAPPGATVTIPINPPGWKMRLVKR